MTSKYRKLGLSLVLILLWQFVYMMDVYPSAVFPSVFEILNEFIQGLMDGSLILSVYYSLKMLLFGILITMFLALILVALSEVSEIFKDLLEILLTIAHPLPGIAIIPLVILWMGIGPQGILFVIIHAMLWPVIVNLKSGLSSISKTYMEMSKVFNFSLIKTFLHIRLMGIIPHFVAGLKIAWARGWRALISSEMVFGVVGSATGLGWYIFEQRVFMNTKGLYAGLLMIILLGLLIENTLFNILESQVNKRWES